MTDASHIGSFGRMFMAGQIDDVVYEYNLSGNGARQKICTKKPAIAAGRWKLPVKGNA